MTIDRNAAIRTLREVVAEKDENYTYKTQDAYGACVYSVPQSDGTFAPSCIIGHVVYRLDPEAFKKITKNEWTFIPSEYKDGEGEEWLQYSVSVDAIAELAERDVFDTSDELLINALRAAQLAQDGGETWVKALTEAEKVFAKEG